MTEYPLRAKMRVKDKVVISTIDEAKSVEAEALFDTGARFTYISERVRRKLGFKLYPEPRKVLLAVKGKEAKVIGHESYILTVAGCKMPFAVGIDVVKDLIEDVIIGTDFMEKFDAYLDLKKGKAKLKRYPPEIVLI